MKVMQNATNIKGYFRFEKLEVWKDAREFVSLIYLITAKFPKDELFGLTNQIRRAAVSIVLNIAEGSTKGSDVDFRRFLKMSQGSVHEVVSGFYIALDQKFIFARRAPWTISPRMNAKANTHFRIMEVFCSLM